jgi:hypothetical protein
MVRSRNSRWRRASTVAPVEGLERLGAAQLAVLNRAIVPFGGLLRGRLAAGETLVVNGATGAYGTAAVLLGLAMGAAHLLSILNIDTSRIDRHILAGIRQRRGRLDRIVPGDYDAQRPHMS